MNLYGDYANINALCRILETNHINYTLEKKTLGDTLNFSEYDFIYMGSGSEENQKFALSHLSDYSKELAAYIEEGKIALFTGNSFEMLGESISSFLGEFSGLGIFSFNVTEQNKTRNTADSIVKFQGQSLVGFINKCSELNGIKTPLFKVEMGLANNPQEKVEGILHKNFFGTHLTGPILVKNPNFLKHLAELLTKQELNLTAFSNELTGYKITLKKLEERNGATK